MPPRKDNPPRTDRIGVIQAVVTPMNFLVLTMLVIEGMFGGMAFSDKFQAQRSLLIGTIIVFLLLLVAIVVCFATWHPGGLSGEKPWQTHLAYQMADDLYLALQGSITNLSTSQAQEAWKTVVDMITSHPDASKPYQEFCVTVGKRLIDLSQIKKIELSPRGIIPDSRKQ